ncbi:MAG TPA: hypothetical protein VFZ76_00500 [Anaerolineales bacterium]
METPMRVYGLNLVELFLEDFLAALGWLLILFAIASRVFAGLFGSAGFSGGLVVATAALAGLVLILASAGIRQNYAALDLAYLLFALATLGWLVHGILAGSAAAVLAGVVMLPLFGLMIYVRRLAIQARFKPRFFSLRQFETMIQIADTMIETNGQNALHPIEVAIRADHFLAGFNAVVQEDIKRTLIIVEWLLPLVIWRPFPFSSLGSHERRRAVQKVIGARGLFRDVARFLKLLSYAGYYGSEEGMAQVGYIPFEGRERSQGVSQVPLQHPDPFSSGADQ